MILNFIFVLFDTVDVEVVWLLLDQDAGSHLKYQDFQCLHL